jgi:TPR repeat protein
MKKLLLTLLTALMLNAAWAGDFEDANLAFDAKNYPLALSKYKKEALKGNGEAAFQVGFIYSTGRGVTKDYSESRKWFKIAVSLGRKEGGFDIGM